jgi:uncharacterized protein YkwD
MIENDPKFEWKTQHGGPVLGWDDAPDAGPVDPRSSEGAVRAVEWIRTFFNPSHQPKTLKEPNIMTPTPTLKNLKLAALAATVALLTACGGGDGDSGGDPADVPLAQAPALVQEYAGLFNNARAQARTCGTVAAPAVPPLTKYNPKLQQAAQKHADDMATNGFFSHTGSDGSDATSRNIAAGYKGLSVVENLAGGYGSSSAIMSAWMNSQGHCLGIMADLAKSVALAQSGPYTVMVFGD